MDERDTVLPSFAGTDLMVNVCSSSTNCSVGAKQVGAKQRGVAVN